MSRKPLFRSNPIPVVLVLLFLTLNAFSFRNTSIASPTSLQPTSTVQQQPIKHPAVVNNKKHYYKNTKEVGVQSPIHAISPFPSGPVHYAGDETYSLAEITEAPVRITEG